MALSGARGTTGELKVVKEDSPVEAKNLKKKCGQTKTAKDCGGKLDGNSQRQAYVEKDGRGGDKLRKKKSETGLDLYMASMQCISLKGSEIILRAPFLVIILD